MQQNYQATKVNMFKYITIFIISLGIFFNAYSQTNSPPTVSHLTIKSTNKVEYITGISAISGATVMSSDGGVTNVARGICWSSNDTLPKISNSDFTSDGVGDGTYISTMIGLSPNTSYYVRSYTTYGYGTTYGPTLTFTTTNNADTPTWCVGVIVHRNTPDRLEIIFNIALLPIIPDVSAFIVKVNNELAVIERIDINRNLVYVYLSTPIKANDVIIISYVKPEINPLTISLNNREVSNIIEYTVNNQLTEDNNIRMLPFVI